ncbi:MAG: terminase small subunit protein [Hyphomicrobiales bacterium]|nr:terminase small subunit protein [Hyphomicrobiales bacterium]
MTKTSSKSKPNFKTVSPTVAAPKRAAPEKKVPKPVIADAYKELMGRPDDYTPETAALICAYMVEGETLLTISRREGMPSKSAMLRWLAKYEDFRDHYARASAVRSGVFMEETIDITDNASNDWMEINDGENRGWRANGENIQRSKLRVETRKWMAIKLLPKMYGDKTVIVHEQPDTSNLTLEEIDTLLPLMAKISSAKAGVN